MNKLLLPAMVLAGCAENPLDQETFEDASLIFADACVDEYEEVSGGDYVYEENIEFTDGNVEPEIMSDCVEFTFFAYENGGNPVSRSYRDYLINHEFVGVAMDTAAVLRNDMIWDVELRPGKDRDDMIQVIVPIDDEIRGTMSQVYVAVLSGCEEIIRINNESSANSGPLSE